MSGLHFLPLSLLYCESVLGSHKYRLKSGTLLFFLTICLFFCSFSLFFIFRTTLLLFLLQYFFLFYTHLSFGQRSLSHKFSAPDNGILIHFFITTITIITVLIITICFDNIFLSVHWLCLLLSSAALAASLSACLAFISSLSLSCIVSLSLALTNTGLSLAPCSSSSLSVSSSVVSPSSSSSGPLFSSSFSN